MYKKFVGLGAMALALAPVVAAAQSFDNFDSAIATITGWINSLIPLLIGIAVLVFLWGVLKYVTAGADEKKRKEGASLVGYGVVAIFVMLSVWGLVNVLISTFDLKNDIPTNIPQVPTSA